MRDERQSRLDALRRQWEELPPVSCEQMIGMWRGEAMSAHSIFATLLSESSWYGKVFRTTEDVDALVFAAPQSVIGLVNRAMIAPWRLPEDRRFVRHPLGAARLRIRALSGVRSAAMCYRYLPIVDHFRRIDAGSVMGFMELRGSGAPELFFRLELADRVRYSRDGI